VNLSIDQVAQAAYQAGFRGTALTYITAIAMRESGGNPGAYNGNVHTGDNSHGLTQINTLGGNGPNVAKMLRDLGYSGNFNDLDNPVINMQVAYKLSGGGTNFEPWRSASPGWSGPQGFLTNATQYIPQASLAAMKASAGQLSNNTTQTRNIQLAQAGNGSAYTQLTSWLNSKVGAQYQFGSRGQNGTYDCSGLTAAAYDQLGIHMDALTWTQNKYGVEVDPSQGLQPGDLLLAHGAQGDLGHVGIYLGGGMVEDAPHTGAQVRVQPLSAWKPQSIRRIIDSTGALIVDPNGLTPNHDASVKTVTPDQAVYTGDNTLMSQQTQQPFNLGSSVPTSTQPTEPFTLGRQTPYTLPGLGAGAFRTLV
jgi:cell wall-associated NlpC family hydrolase